MASTGAVGGSQIDVQSLVSQLVAADRATPDAQIARDSQRVTTQISAVGQLMGSMSSFRSALSSLKTVDVFSTRSGTSSDGNVLTAAANTKAVPGTYSIDVEQLATAQQISSKAFAGGSTTAVGTGTLTVSLGTKSFDIDVTSDSSSLAGIRDAINSAEKNPGVRATIVQGSDGAHLVLSSSITGAANTISVAQSGGDGGLAQLTYSADAPANYSVIQSAQDAKVHVANVTVTSDTNTVSDAIDGVTLTLKHVTGEDDDPVTVTIGYDKDAVAGRIKNFVNAYNALEKQIATLRSYDPATKAAGPMIGDSLLSGIENELRSSISASVTGQPAGFQTLSSIGITTQSDGTLAIDDTKLQKGLTGNFDAVGALFGSENGVAARMFAQVDARLKSDGPLESRSKNLVQEQTDIGKRKDELDARMKVIQDQYLQQFTRLDTLLSQLQVTSSYLSQQIESLANMRKASS
jgi:flagellar hook-associated protein 2